MIASLENLAYLIRVHREHIGLSQEKLAEKVGAGVNRSNVAHVEQARRLPKPEILKKICEYLKIPNQIWSPFLHEKSLFRINFESTIKELVGKSITSLRLDETAVKVVEDQIYTLFKSNLSEDQCLDQFNSILIFYGLRPITKSFYKRYLKFGSFSELESFESAVKNYLKDAIRLFSTISEAFEKLNSGGPDSFNSILLPIAAKETTHFTNRTDWNRIKRIPDQELPFLGYIAAARVRQEERERKELSDFLKEMARKKKDGTIDLDSIGAKKKKRMDSLLRKFESKIEHGLFSKLFNPDIALLESEAEFISPDNATDLEKMERTQLDAYNNLSQYLTADYMDIYVATSMRSDADFISVNNFVESLFDSPDIRQFKLRYFNPTQSWIEDRVAKGLVEALMLRRADICIYMAQKEDTFGKDSEASVTLGQGKPVIVYVPKLSFPERGIDTEKFGAMDRNELIRTIRLEVPSSEVEIDDASDVEALHSSLLHGKIEALSNNEICEVLKIHWANFDLYSETEKRINDEPKRLEAKNVLNQIIKNNAQPQLSPQLKEIFKDILVANAMRYERRAKIFKEIHPLALQVILSTGVLNGILVVRSVAECSSLIKSLIENKLDLELEIDDYNYRLIEKSTKSTIRVVSKHKLLSNAFATFYSK
jgi:transcriptional regulator with XRE-family HTH domain